MLFAIALPPSHSVLRRLCRYFSSVTKGTASPDALPVWIAVVRYDNNCATVPFVGSAGEAEALKDRMETNTHKHHIYLMKSAVPSVPIGPYQSLDAVRLALQQNSKKKQHKMTRIVDE